MTSPHEPSTPFAAPQPDMTVPPVPPLLEPIENGWFKAAKIVLVVVGAFYILFGAIMGLVFGAGLDPEMDEGAALFMGVFMFLFCSGFGVANFVASWGLAKQTKWGWISAVVLGALYAPSACLPFGVVILIGCLHDDVRKKIWP